MKRLHNLFSSPYKIDLQVRSFSHSSLQSSNEATFRMRFALLSLPLRQALKVGVQVPCRVNKTVSLVKFCLNLNWAAELLNINISLSIQYQLFCLLSYQYQYHYQLSSRGLININTLSIIQKVPLSISISISPINITL